MYTLLSRARAFVNHVRVAFAFVYIRELEAEPQARRRQSLQPGGEEEDHA